MLTLEDLIYYKAKNPWKYHEKFGDKPPEEVINLIPKGQQDPRIEVTKKAQIGFSR